MPTRDVPRFIQEAHEVCPGDEFDIDWTKSDDEAEEMRRRAERNEIIREMLLKGKTVAYRESGWSLHPRVSSNNLCSYIPVRYPEQVNKGDVVFCIVQPRGLYHAHLVHTIQRSGTTMPASTSSGSATSRAESMGTVSSSTSTGSLC